MEHTVSEEWLYLQDQDVESLGASMGVLVNREAVERKKGFWRRNGSGRPSFWRSKVTSETFEYLHRFASVQALKKRMRERFSSFEGANDPIPQSEAKLTEDVHRQIVEMRRMGDYSRRR
jgi:hypothetical protein